MNGEPESPPAYPFKRPEAPPVRTALTDNERTLLNWLCGAGLAGVFLLWQNGSAFRTAFEARAWPTAPGQVDSVEIVPGHDDNGQPTYEVVVKYSYDVGGVTHTGDRLDLRDPVKHERISAQQVAAEYRNGRPIAVRYNPQNPEVAIVDVAITGENWILTGLGLFLTALGAGAIYMLWLGRS